MPPLDMHTDAMHACQLAEVVAVDDPSQLGRVKIRLTTMDAEGAAEIWAAVAVPFAGNRRGAFFIPDVGDEVVVTFLAGDSRHPIVIGALWSGRDIPPEQLPGKSVDRWSITGKAGTRIAIVEVDAASAKIELSTPGGVKATLTDESGGSMKIEDSSGNTITIDAQGITLQTSANVTVNASQVDVTAGMVKVDAALSKFSGVVQCDTLIATSVVGTSYTPGAGNVW
jgi:uncharacterized protein involved in type VI secretion and phage assembly